MVEIGQLGIMDVLADATNTIAEGEVLQLINGNNPDTTEQQYMEVIYRKTAKLFEAGMFIGAILAGQTRAVEDGMTEYGRQLGVAFQLVDEGQRIYGYQNSEWSAILARFHAVYLNAKVDGQETRLDDYHLELFTKSVELISFDPQLRN